MEDRKGSPTWRRVWRFEDEDYTQARLEPWICYGGGGGGDGPSAAGHPGYRSVPAPGTTKSSRPPSAAMGRTATKAAYHSPSGRAAHQNQGAGEQSAGRVAAMKDLSGAIPGRHGKYVAAYAGAGEWKPPEKKEEPKEEPKEEEKPAAAPSSTPSSSPPPNIPSYTPARISLEDMLADMQARYDEMAKEFQEKIDAGLQAQQDMLAEQVAKTEDKKKKLKHRRKYGRLSLMSGSELGIQSKLGVAP